MNYTVVAFTVSTKILYIDAAVVSPIHLSFTLLNMVKIIRPT